MYIGSLGKKTIKIFAVLSLALTALAVILRTVCLAFFYDELNEGVGYFTKGVLPTLFTVLCCMSVILFFLAALISKKVCCVSDGKEDNVALKIVSACAMLGFASFFVGTISTMEFVNLSTVFDLLVKISSLMAIIYFAMNIFGVETVKAVQVVLGFGIVVWTVCILAITYFNINVPMNSPEKTYLHLALVALMVFFVSEFRSFLVKINKPLYVFTLSCAVFFSGVETVPSLIKFFSLGMADYDYLYYDIVIFTLFLYVTVRLVSFAFFIDTRKKAEELSAVENSDETENEV